MVNKRKESGSRWEREVTDRLDGKKQPSSGAFGTQHKDAQLTGDVVKKYPWLSKALHLECKYGYGGSKQMTIHREWFSKVREEAERARRFPAVVIKFRDVTGGDIESSKVICFNLDTWERIVDEINSMFMHYVTLIEENYERTKENE